jgi:hypothetical protein
MIIMKKLSVLILAVLTLTFCKGPSSGPLVKESFDKATTEEAPAMAGQKSTGPVKTEKISDAITPCEGCLKISDLFADAKSYKEKEIKVTGKVVKFNEAIMGKNWIHIQDGTEFEGAYDLTVTTSEMVNVGDIVTLKGTIAIDRDFGYGYKYDILLENGVLVK